MKHLLSSKPDDDGLPPRARALAMAALMLCSLMAVLDMNIVNVALPTISETLDVSSSDAIWIVNVYQLTGAAAILTFAALSYRIGAWRIYIGGLIVFVASSLGCALSNSLTTLIVFRAFQGLGAAAMMSLGPALYRSVFPSRLLGSALGVSSMVVATGVAAGPTLGGVLLALGDWPLLFLINLPMGAAALVLTLRYLPRSEGNGAPFDVLGAVLSALMLGGLVIGVDELRREGSMSWAVYLAVGFIAGAAFIRRQQRIDYPLLPLGIFRQARFSMAAVTSFFAWVSQSMAFLSVPFLLQSELGYTPLESALLFTPWPLAIMFTAPRAGRLADKFSPPLVCTGGIIVFIAGVIALATLSSSAPMWDVVWRTALCGFGFGLYQSPNNRELMGSLPRAQSGTAAGVMASVRTFGQSLGAALVALALSGIIIETSHAGLITLALNVAIVAALIALALSASRLTRARALADNE
ncbi:MFS transporter [Larsenimonas suaedae]|uniref:MFS transporter n=1 Tax=Larsenimonas suaedae TaxID=1851019 RepID=A0ABU1GWX9_9GAMM|nr:MFS transporter [Larsenimonas suaedae]MCM2973117.1 MFS transporter [Larsenimonas suaedae]MDR5896554.1 MFS transporter [Larsenimonas suaedae]